MEIVIEMAEARRCHECKQPGRLILSRPVMGGTLHTFQCETKECPWENTTWYVETNTDGKVQVNEAAYKATHIEIVAPIDPLIDRRIEAVQQAVDQQIAEEQRNHRG